MEGMVVIPEVKEILGDLLMGFLYLTAFNVIVFVHNVIHFLCNHEISFLESEMSVLIVLLTIYLINTRKK